MKRAFILVIAFVIFVFGLTVSAENDSTSVYVTFANGDLIECLACVDVSDVDGDGTLTVNDTFICFHDQYFEGGSEAGFNAEEGAYGLFITKLWGIENGGSYGYYLNNVSCGGLTDEVANGDMLYAFAYTDLTTWSDTYTWFETSTAAAKAGDAVELILFMAGYDETWAPVSIPVEGAAILINGEETAFVTAQDGKVSIEMPSVECVISAKTDIFTMVPPVCCILIAE